MKHIKLFENFNQDDLEEIKWIMIELDEYSHLNQIELDGNLLIYNIDSEDIDGSNLRTAGKRLIDLGYYYITTPILHQWIDINLMIIYNIDYFEDSSKEGIAFKWLTDKFSDLTKSTDMNKTYYKNENGDNIFMFFNNERKPDCFINNELVYLFLELRICLDTFKITSVIKKWLKESYNLNNFSDILEHDF